MIVVPAAPVAEICFSRRYATVESVALPALLALAPALLTEVLDPIADRRTIVEFLLLDATAFLERLLQ